MNRLLLVLGLTLAVTAAACGGRADDDGGSAGETLKVGVTIEKTGPVPTLGSALRGIEAAAEYLNANGGIAGRRVELVVRDNAGDPSKAIGNVKEFASQGIQVVVGPAFGANCFGTAAEFARADMVDFCISTDDLPEQDDHMFGVGTDYTTTTEVDFDLMKRLGGKIGTFAAKDKSGDDSARLARREADERGTQIEIQRHDTNATALKPQIQKLLADGADILNLTSCAPVTVTAAKEAIDLGFQGRILIENCHVSKESANAVKDFANDQIIALTPQFMLGKPDPGDPRADAIALYDEHLGTDDLVVAAGWDALLMAGKAIEEAGGTDADKLVSTLENGFEYVGPWAWNKPSADDHRGGQAEGALIPASITADGGFAELPEGGGS